MPTTTQPEAGGFSEGSNITGSVRMEHAGGMLVLKPQPSLVFTVLWFCCLKSELSQVEVSLTYVRNPLDIEQADSFKRSKNET